MLVVISFMDNRRHPAVAFFFSLICFQHWPPLPIGVLEHRVAGMA
jgi:hypothetical protein